MRLFAKRRYKIMRGMHIKGRPRPAFFFFCQPDKLSQEKQLSERGGPEATVTSHEMLADNTYEGNAHISL